MKTNIQTIWSKAKQPILVGVVAFFVGSALGLVAPARPLPRSCPASMMHGHSAGLQSWLIAHFDIPSPARRSPTGDVGSSQRSTASSEPLRPAAPDAPESSSAESSNAIPAASSTAPSSETSSASSAESSLSLLSSDSSESPASSSATSFASSESLAPAKPSEAGFPAFGHASYPVGRTPNWGAMTTPAEWERDYDEMDRSDFTRLPVYDLAVLTTPMSDLLKTRDDPETIRILTAKLFYSTRFFGTYDLDAGEFTGDHAGIDLKLPKGMPFGAIAGGRVSSVIREESGLGLHVTIEHRLGDETFYSIYGHLSSVSVKDGQDIAPGDMVGRVGSTGRSTSPHLHLQIDRGAPGEAHEPYWPGTTPSRAEAALHTLNPMAFIANH